MRQIETTRASAVAATQQLSPPPAAAAATKPPCDPRVHDCRWWPYSSSGDFGAHTAMVVIILLCAFICALALNAAVRCFLRNTTRRRPPSGSHHVVQERKTSSEMVYSSSSGMMMKLNDCSICLSEFAEGERVRVLERCKHGFHARCIDTWLSGHSSCPTCRATCFVLPPHLPPPPLLPPQNSSNSAAGERVDDREIDGVVVGVDADVGPPTTGYGDVIN